MSDLKGVRVLVVDDDQDTLDVECALLQREGCAVVCVDSVRAALSALREGRPDLVITDYSMPVEDGFDLIHLIKAHPELVGIPTLMLTAHAEPELRQRALGEGFTEVLTKPVEPTRLVGTVERLVAAPA
ncbi:MAG TPA: response regulator [Vicinamibacteria bacterium]|jgi:CheY-like chemotaxis protein|nr:response regulator [Vicinamibacteria bacterium]